MTVVREPCSPACAELCRVEVVVGYLMHLRGLDTAGARTELVRLARDRRSSQHQAAREILDR